MRDKIDDVFIELRELVMYLRDPLKNEPADVVTANLLFRAILTIPELREKLYDEVWDGDHKILDKLSK